jgi:hypothetical protein
MEEAERPPPTVNDLATLVAYAMHASIGPSVLDDRSWIVLVAGIAAPPRQLDIEIVLGELRGSTRLSAARDNRRQSPKAVSFS